MNIERVGRTLLGAAALCLLLVNAGCGSNPSSDNGGTFGGTSGGTQLASVQNAGDWGASLLPGGGTGVGMFPAKFTFDVTLAPDCTNDYVAYNTSVAGVSPTAAATQTGNWTATLATSGTVTITSPEAILVLTWAAGMNSGLNFSGTTQALEATELAVAINRNNFATLGQGHVRVMAATNATVGQVVVTASSDGTTGLNGAEGNVIGLTQTINAGRFTWSAATMAGGLGKGNIVAFNQLYSTQGSVGGFCNQNGPSPDWAYFTGAGGAGTAVTSVVIAGDGKKVAFVENVAGTATLRILQWKAGEGVGAGYPVVPTLTLAAGTSWATGCPTGGSSCLRSIAFSGAAATDTNSSPFYNYNTDTMYVGDNSGRMHKFTGVFLGTPAESCAAGCGVVDAGWPITVHAGFILTSPVFDGMSGNIFVGDSNGRLSFIQEVGSTVGGATPCTAPCINTVSRQVGTAGAIIDAPIVDGTTGRVLAVNGTETASNGTILQADTGLTTASVHSFAIGGSGVGSAIYSGAFDNTYFTSASPAIAGHMYVCGKDPGFRDRPAIYQLSFGGTGILTGVGTSLTALVSASGEACSPVTEFFNPNGSAVAPTARDWIFFSFGNLASGAAPIPVGTCRSDGIGCVMSINVTSEPAWPPTAAGAAALSIADAVPANATGGTGGIVVDNDAVIATSPQAANIYFSLGTASTGAGVGIPSCNTTAGTGCAVKLTQIALQ